MKIGVIGGAGVRTVIFINGLLKRYKKLGIDEVVLYDIDRAKLAIIGKLCRHVVAREGKDLTVREVNDAVDAIRGSHRCATGDMQRTMLSACGSCCRMRSPKTL